MARVKAVGKRVAVTARRWVVSALSNRTRASSSVRRGLSLVEQLERRLTDALEAIAPGRWRKLETRPVTSALTKPVGHIDKWTDDTIGGWAWVPVLPEHRVTLIVTAGGKPIATATANQLRKDVRDAGFGDGRYGFRIAVNLKELARSAGDDVDHVEVQALDPQGHAVSIGTVPLLANLRIDGLFDRLSPSFMRHHILPWLGALACPPRTGRERASRPARDEGHAPAYQHLFIESRPSTQLQSADDFQPRPTLSPYVRYASARVLANQPIDRSPQAADAQLRWYLDVYQDVRSGYRAPLSPEEVRYLNAPFGHIAGMTTPTVSRVSLSYYLEEDGLRGQLNLTEEDEYQEFVYWWSIEKAAALGVEDCLVPEYYRETLLELVDREFTVGLPTSAFVRTYVKRSGMEGVNLRNVDHALGVYLHLLLKAIQRPDLLRYVPDTVLNLLLKEDADGECRFDDLAAAAMAWADTDSGSTLASSGSTLASDSGPRPCETLEQNLNAAGFDLASRTFRSVDSDGYRLHAAMLPGPPRDGPVSDVQIIGPFRKASGLGQACRLAADITKETGYSVNLVDFGMDNPAPEGFSTTIEVDEPARARVNLIHLNAESIPLAYAYLPDLYADSYNIGFFYWELDSPAACHELALDLLDEIWVATEYGVSQYQPHTGAPVSNVGTAFEDIPDIEREDARTMVRERYGIGEETFVFLATFDSFSFVTRKNPVGTIRAFQAAFPEGTEDVALLLKTQNRRRVKDARQISEMQAVQELSAMDPRVTVIDETLAYRDILRMKKGSDAYVSLHRSEGWGFGPIEAMALGVPVIATAYSGNMEFCRPETAWLVDYELVAVQEKDYIFVKPGQRWADPSVDDAATQMRSCYEDEGLRAKRAEAGRELVASEFSVAAIARRYKARLEAIFAELDERVS